MRHLHASCALALCLAGPAAAQEQADWSGVWGGVSAGGSQLDYDGHGLSDGSRFCVAQAYLPGASVGCTMGDDFVEYQMFFEGAAGGSDYVLRRYSEDGTRYSENEYVPPLASENIETEITGSFDIRYLRSTVMTDGAGGTRAVAGAVYDVFSFDRSTNLSDSAMNLGAHLRRDWQFDNRFVAGVEGQFEFLSDNSSGWSASDSRPLGQVSITASQSVAVSTEALASLRLRGGYAIGNALPYVTAGLGFGRFDGEVTKAMPELFAGSGSGRTTDTVNKWAAAPVLGGGVSWMLTERVALSSEALYYFFNDDLTFDDSQSVGLEGIWSAMAKISFKLN